MIERKYFPGRKFVYLLTLNRPEQQASLAFLTQNGMTFSDIECLLKETAHTLYPVVVTREHPYVVGQIQRRDLQVVLSTSFVNQMRFANIRLESII